MPETWNVNGVPVSIQLLIPLFFIALRLPTRDADSPLRERTPRRRSRFRVHDIVNAERQDQMVPPYFNVSFPWPWAVPPFLGSFSYRSRPLVLLASPRLHYRRILTDSKGLALLATFLVWWFDILTRFFPIPTASSLICFRFFSWPKMASLCPFFPIFVWYSYKIFPMLSASSFICFRFFSLPSTTFFFISSSLFFP